MKLPKRITYTPGMISLVMLPVLIMGYLNRLYFEPSRLRAMEVVWNTNYRPAFDKASSYRSFYAPVSPIRNWTEVELTGDMSANKMKLTSARAQIKTMVNSRDTTAGVHFVLGTGATYGTFVRVLNMLLADSIPTYRVQDNGIWVMNVYLRPEILSSDSTELTVRVMPAL